MDPARAAAFFPRETSVSTLHWIRVVGATLPPCEGAMFVTAEKNETRMAVNRRIRRGGLFDAVIDFERALRDPERPSRLRLDADSGDHLHPNAVGHRLLAEAIDVRALVAP